jgi:hypothetical protein
MVSHPSPWVMDSFSSTTLTIFFNLSLVWWHNPVISALRKLRQEDLNFKASLGYIVRNCLKNQTNKKIF